MNKSDRFYFNNFVEAAGCACQAAEYLAECLSAYEPGKIESMLEAMHKFEHQADQKKHEMSTALAKAFVTPLDREDLASLSHTIDDVTDSIEEVLQRFYVGQIQKMLPQAVEFAKKITKCCNLMKNMLSELENFKKSETLRTMIIEINHEEEECDRLYMDASVSLWKLCEQKYEVFLWREIFDYMENCADACEHVADSVETIVMKNT